MMDLTEIESEGPGDTLKESDDEEAREVFKSFVQSFGDEYCDENIFNCNNSESLLDRSTREDRLMPQPTNCGSKVMIKESDNKTLIHNGDTDSSDDEGNKYCFESKYSESGKTLKKLLVEKEKKSPLREKSVYNNNSSWKKSQNLESCGVQTEVSVDGILGIRIVKPLVSSAFVTEKMQGRKTIPLSRLKHFVASEDTSVDWVVAAVIVKKSSMRTSQKGSRYYIWRLSDLKGDLKTFSLFLFRNAAKEIWKTSEGTAVAILNPGVLGNRDGNGDEATLSVDNAQKVLIMGSSKDLGYCKARKKNGETCTSFVNKNQCEFCVYHLKQEYKKCSARAELQSRTPRGGLMSMRNKVLGKHEVFYAGKCYSAIPAKYNTKQQEKDNTILKSLCGMKKPESLFQSRLVPITQDPPHVTKFLIQAKNDAERLKSLEQNCDKTSSLLELKPAPNKKLLTLGVPELGKGGSFRVDLTMPASRMQKEQAKMNAMKWLQLNGPIKRTDPNSTKKEEKTKRLKLTDSREALNSFDSTEKLSTKDSLLKSSKFLELMKAKSKHIDLLTANEKHAEEEYFNKLEQKERLELKMLETFKISCKAVRCIKCKYTALSASELCKTERHPLKILNAMKRFFKCDHCSNRTITLDLIPLHACSNCGSSSWVRAPMIREKRTALNVQPLSIRGDEEAFLGSVANQGHLNLLVPDLGIGK